MRKTCPQRLSGIAARRKVGISRQFSYAAMLAEHGQIEAALEWLHKALEGGNLKFLRVAHKALAAANDPQIRAMADAYQQRAEELQEPASRLLRDQT